MIKEVDPAVTTYTRIIETQPTVTKVIVEGNATITDISKIIKMDPTITQITKVIESKPVVKEVVVEADPKFTKVTRVIESKSFRMSARHKSPQSTYTPYRRTT